MITRLRVQNWKSFADAEIYLDPLTVLVGANDSGKSNLLEALWFLGRLPTAVSIESIFSSESGKRYYRGNPIDAVRRGMDEATLEVDIDGGKIGSFVYKIALVYWKGTLRVASESLQYGAESELKPNKYVYESKLNEDYSSTIQSTLVGATGRGRPKLHEFDRSRPILVQILLASQPDELKNTAHFIASALSKISILDPRPDRMRVYSKLSDQLNEDASNIAGYLAYLDPVEKEDTEIVIKQLLVELIEENITSVYAEPIPPVNADAQLLAKGGDATSLMPIDGRLLSDGTLRFVAIATAVATALPGSLLVIEEVESGLHSSKASHLASFLKQQAIARKVDLLITTHSATLLDALGPEIVQFTYVVHRHASNSASAITYLSNEQSLPSLLASGGLGTGLAQGKLAKILAK